MLATLLPLGVIGPTQIIIIVVLIVVLFGGKKIPELMRGVGRGMKEFKDAMNTDYSKENDAPQNRSGESKKQISDKDNTAN